MKITNQSNSIPIPCKQICHNFHMVLVLHAWDFVGQQVLGLASFSILNGMGYEGVKEPKPLITF